MQLGLLCQMAQSLAILVWTRHGDSLLQKKASVIADAGICILQQVPYKHLPADQLQRGWVRAAARNQQHDEGCSEILHLLPSLQFNENKHLAV